MHNHYRAHVDPPANNMEIMSWDDVIENNAQAWADQCIWGHSSQDSRNSVGSYSYLGENIYVKSAGLGYAQDSVDSWASEVEYYNYQDNSCTQVCGHYTQVVWDASANLGCAHAHCPTMQGASWCADYGGCEYVVCQYGPGGNFPRQPYTTGQSCSACPDGFPDCVDNMCSTGEIEPTIPPGPPGPPATPPPTAALPYTPPPYTPPPTAALPYTPPPYTPPPTTAAHTTPPAPAPAPGPAPAPAGEGACAGGYCEGPGSDNICHCDALCISYGDCCADACDECSHCGSTLVFYVTISTSTPISPDVLDYISLIIASILGVSVDQVYVEIYTPDPQVTGRRLLGADQKESTALRVAVTDYEDPAAATSAGEVLEAAVADGTLVDELVNSGALHENSKAKTNGFLAPALGPQPLKIALKHFRWFGDAFSKGDLIVLTTNSGNQYGNAYIGSKSVDSLGLTTGANVELTFTLKMGGAPLADSATTLPTAIDAGRRRLTADDQASRRLATCQGRGFALQIFKKGYCLTKDEGIESCGGHGFFFITEDKGNFRPGIYSLAHGEVRDWNPDISLVNGRISQIKITWGPGHDQGTTNVQLYIDENPVLSTIHYTPTPSEKGDALIFEAATADGCTEEHIVSNVHVTSDADLPEDYKGLLQAYLENPKFLDQLGKLTTDEEKINIQGKSKYLESYPVALTLAILVAVVVLPAAVLSLVKRAMFRAKYFSTAEGSAAFYGFDG